MISASIVKELREKTGVGMMECKKALTETNGDLEKAIIWLREHGMARAAKKADRVAAEGVIELAVSDKQDVATILELNCETDFVAKNQEFINFAKEAVKLALNKKITSSEELLKTKMSTGHTVEESITDLISKIGENIKLRRLSHISVKNGLVCGYMHFSTKIGTLVAIEGANNPKVAEIAKDITMHIAAAAPKYISPSDVDKNEIELEKEIARKKLLEEKKPENIIEKILAGQVQKFYKEVCLNEQPFVKDPNITVGKLLKDSGLPVKISSFIRFQVGEGVEKKDSNSGGCSC